MLVMTFCSIYSREKLGMKDVHLNWYENYLKPRCFKVCINKPYSPQKAMDFSIPQGSTQGTYLFICYPSTISEIVPKSNGISIHTDEDDAITIIEKSIINIKLCVTLCSHLLCSIGGTTRRLIDLTITIFIKSLYTITILVRNGPVMR